MRLFAPNNLRRKERSMTKPSRPSTSRRDFCKSAAAVSLLGAIPGGAAFGQSYPSKPVRFILPFGAGGVADTTSRLVAEKLGDKLGQRFVIENMPGPGSIAAARAALQGGTDGHTLLLMTNGTAISVPLFKSLPFDAVKDFVPVSSIGTFECLMVVNAGSAYKTLADFVKACKDKPGKINVGTIAAGSTQHLTAELFKSTADVEFVIVPFKTTGEAVVGLLRNDVDMVIDFLAALKSGITDGKTRALAWTGPEPSPSMPEIPAAIKTVPGFEVVSWNAMYAPAGTPQAVIDTLNKALQEVLADPTLKKRALELGIDLKASTPAEIHARLQADIKKWAAVIERAKIERR
jgi:tripartite-type tricarboxylate transporter receptor subunit TctC